MNIQPSIKALILDMDGVLWRNTAPIGDLPAIFARIHERELKAVMATNNATKTVEQFLAKFANFGVRLEPQQIVTSAVATAHTLAVQYPAGGPVYVVGEDGIQHALEDEGFGVITDPEDDTPVISVVAAMDRHITYPKLRRAGMHIRAGAAFYGTNPDKTFPTPQGLAPGAGSILAAIEAAGGVAPIIIGKPQPAMMLIALERLGTKPEETLVVGDRLETDIIAGQAAGCKTALVLSGVSTQEQVENWSPMPDMILKNLATLLEQA